MSISKPIVKCGNCGTILDEGRQIHNEDRNPCPECGSLKRAVNISTGGSISFHSKLKLKARHRSGRRPFVEQVTGDDLHRKSRKWMKLQRVIDRAKNWYSEIVVDPESKRIVHRCEEPLTDHQGHGTVRKVNKHNQE